MVLCEQHSENNLIYGVNFSLATNAKKGSQQQLKGSVINKRLDMVENVLLLMLIPPFYSRYESMEEYFLQYLKIPFIQTQEAKVLSFVAKKATALGLSI